MGMLIDLAMLYWLFDSRVFAGRNAWPPGIAAGEAIMAGDKGGRRAIVLVVGTGVGLIGSWLTVPMSAFGVAFIGNMFALTMFGVGLLLRGYSTQLFGFDLNTLYVPHGMMIGAGLVALIQVGIILRQRGDHDEGAERTDDPLSGGPEQTAGTLGGDQGGIRGGSLEVIAPAGYTRSDDDMGRGLMRGFALYIAAGTVLAFAAGLYPEMPVAQLVVWVIYAAVACIAAEFIVGLSAMHAGWFPAFATALIFLVLGMLMGFPSVPLAILTGFVASGGPAFADAGYDLKSGWYLRGGGRNRAFEMYGRRQQLIAGFMGLAVAWVMVTIFHPLYFNQNLFPPVDRVYVATINARRGPGDHPEPDNLGNSRRHRPGDWRARPADGHPARDRPPDCEPSGGLGGAGRHRHQAAGVEVLRRTGRVPAHHLRRWRHRWRCAVGIWQRRFQGEVDVVT